MMQECVCKPRMQFQGTGETVHMPDISPAWRDSGISDLRAEAAFRFEKPEIINAKRRERIAKGSGTTVADVNRLMKQFEETRKMMKMVAGGNMRMPKMPRGGFRR